MPAKHCTAGTLLLALLLSAASAASQTTPDVQELKQKLQQLEQTVSDLKTQLAALERAQARPAPPVTEQVPAPAQLPAPQAVPRATAPELAQLPAPHQIPAEEYISRETRVRNPANQNQVGAPRIFNEPLEPELRGYFRVPGTGTLIKLGGFVKNDFFYDLTYAGTYYGAYVPSSFPSSPTPKSSNSTVSMRPSRFSVEFRQPLEAAETYEYVGLRNVVKAYFEFDFLSNYDRNSLRLRQFYAQYRNLLAGQTWSAFGDPDVFPDTLEFEGPPGIMGLRQPQFRYTYPLNKKNSIGASVEKSGTDTPFSTQFGVPTGTSLWPDFVFFHRYENKYGHLHTAALVRSVGGFIQNTTVPDLTNHVVGYGLSVSGLWGLGAYKDNVVFQFIVGKGVSNYYNDNFGLGTDVGFNSEGRLEATPTASVTAGYTHYWTKSIRSSFSYGYLNIDNAASDPGTTYHTSQYATANMIFQPTVRFLYGAEYIYGSARRKEGFIWIAPRIQASITYYLNKYPAE